MNKLSKFSYGLAIVLFATSTVAILGMEPPENGCKCLTEKDIRNISDEQFVKNFTPCVKSTYGAYWQREYQHRQQAKLKQLAKEKKEDSSWSNWAYSYGLQGGNILMTTVGCPMLAHTIVSNVDQNNRLQANIAANVGCQGVRYWLFESRIQDQKIRRAVRERAVQDIVIEMHEKR